MKQTYCTGSTANPFKLGAMIVERNGIIPVDENVEFLEGVLNMEIDYKGISNIYITVLVPSLADDFLKDNVLWEGVN
jgi:hypothetical protein